MAIRAFIPSGPNRGTNAHPSTQEWEGANVVAAKGSPLVETAGYLVEAGANPTALWGISDEVGHNVAAGLKLLRYSFLNNVFEGTLYSAGSGSIALAQTDLGAKYGITRVGAAGTLWFVDQDKTGSNARVLIVGFKDPVGTTDARVYFLVLNANKAEA